MDILYAVIPYILSFGVFSATYREFFSRGIHDILGITLFFGNICFLVGMLVCAVSEEYVLYAEIGVAVVFLVLQFVKPKETHELKPPGKKKVKETKRTITLEDILGE